LLQAAARDSEFCDRQLTKRRKIHIELLKSLSDALSFSSLETAKPLKHKLERLGSEDQEKYCSGEFTMFGCSDLNEKLVRKLAFENADLQPDIRTSSQCTLITSIPDYRIKQSG